MAQAAAISEGKVLRRFSFISSEFLINPQRRMFELIGCVRMRRRFNGKTILLEFVVHEGSLGAKKNLR